MRFPNFLRIASIPLVDVVDLNETTSLEKEMFDYCEAPLAKIISENLKFSYQIVTPKDRQWGSPLSDGNWSGMVGLVQRNEADLIICSLSITEERSQVVDYSYPYLIDQLVFLTRPLENSIDKKSLLKPFSTDVWICLCATILILPTLHWILFQINLSIRQSPIAYRNILRQSINTPRSLGDYILRYSWWMFQAILRWSYAAVLLSYLTFPYLTGVRNTAELADAFRREDFQCMAYPGSFVADFLLKSEDTDLKALGQCVKESPGHPDFDFALSSSRLSKRLAYIGRESRFIDARKKYFVYTGGFSPNFLAIGVKKGFCCKAQLDSAIHYIWASGIYDKLKKEYSRKETHKMLWNPLSKDDHVDHRSLSFGDFEGAFILLASGYSLALLVLLFEIVCKKKIILYLFDLLIKVKVKIRKKEA